MGIYILTAIVFLLETQTHGVRWEAGLYGDGYTGQKIELTRERSHYALESFTGEAVRLQRVDEKSATFLLNYENQQMLIDVQDTLRAYLQSKPIRVGAGGEHSALLDGLFSLDSNKIDSSLAQTDAAVEEQEYFQTSDEDDAAKDIQTLTVSNIGSIAGVSFKDMHVFLARIQ